MAGKVSQFWIENGPKLIEEAEKRIVNGRMPRGGWIEVAQILGVPDYACAHQYTRLRNNAGLSAGLSRSIAARSEVDPVEQEQRRIERVRTLTHERDLLKAVAGERSFRAFLEELVRETAQAFPAPPPYSSLKGRAASTKAGVIDETMLLQLSDFHAPEIVDGERTRGFNEYNSKVAMQRARRVVDTHLSIKARLERGGWRFRKLVVGANGDFVSGTIHEVERHTDAKNIVQAVYGTGLLLGMMIRDLAAQYEEVEVFCTSGNHGRLPDAKRVQQKDSTRSWDTMVYLYAKEHLRALPNVKFYIPNSYSVAFNVEGWNFIQTHGHDIRSWNQIPFYGIDRMVRNINALEASRGNIVHYWLMGHFHSASSLPMNVGEVFINGSLVGATEYSVQGLGKADQPKQWMMGVHREHGVSHRWPLVAVTKPDAPGYWVEAWGLPSTEFGVERI